MFRFLIIMVTGLAVSLNAQFYESSKYSGIGIPFFEAEVFRTFAPDMKKTRINVYFEVLHDDLTFVKSDTGAGFRTDFELVSAIFDENETQITAASSQETLTLPDYENTNSRVEKIYLVQNFELNPGNYEIKMQLRDLVSKKHANRKLSIKVDAYSEKSFAMSDLLFVNTVEMDSAGNLLDFEPRVRDNLDRKSDVFYVYFNTFSPEIPKSLEMNFILEGPKEKVELDSTFSLEVTENKGSHVLKIDKSRLSKNRYKCILRSEDEEAESVKNLSFFWVGVPETSDDLSLALRQMRYIVDGDSLDKYEEAPLEEQKKYFTAYWTSNDPNPATAINELMEEYFRRVNFANREYSNFSEGGWLSDRGRILIKFGFPDDVERHPFEINSIPYEIWRYYSLRKVFLFMDQTGFGDYRLHPDYIGQEYQP